MRRQASNRWLDRPKCLSGTSGKAQTQIDARRVDRESPSIRLWYIRWQQGRPWPLHHHGAVGKAWRRRIAATQHAAPRDWM